MSTHNDKIQEDKSYLAIRTIAQKQNEIQSATQFSDYSPSAIKQRKLQEDINKSPLVIQSKAYQEMADHSPQVKQSTALQAKADEYTLQSGNTIQRKVDAQITGNRKPMDMANDGTLAVYNGDVQGGFFATDANNAIARATQAVPPERGIIWQQGGTITLKKVNNKVNRMVGNPIVMTEINAQWSGDTSQKKLLPRDCGGTARELMGADDLDTAGGNKKSWALNNDAADNPRTPFDAKRAIMEAHFGATITGAPGYPAALKTYNEIQLGDNGFDNAQVALDAIIMGPYVALSEEDRKAFDAKYQINQFAMAKPGEARVTTRHGAYTKADDYPFHWSGTIVESNNKEDYVTLENFLNWGTDGMALNANWVHKMYGTAPGESFHESMVSEGGYGDFPITMGVSNQGSYKDGIADAAASLDAANENPTYLAGFTQFNHGLSDARQEKANAHPEQGAYTQGYDAYLPPSKAKRGLPQDEEHEEGDKKR